MIDLTCKVNEVHFNSETEVMRQNNVECNYRIVDAKHVLWTCHKACKIEHYDCSYCMCSVCYTTKTTNVDNSTTKVTKKKSKRRRTSCSIDDDNERCKHNLEDLVPFMDQSFFSTKYKTTIAQEKYKLPVVCSICNYELVDRLKNDDSATLNASMGAIIPI